MDFIAETGTNSVVSQSFRESNPVDKNMDHGTVATGLLGLYGDGHRNKIYYSRTGKLLFTLPKQYLLEVEDRHTSFDKTTTNFYIFVGGFQIFLIPINYIGPLE